MSSSRPVESLELLGGVLCLDFVNTVDPRHAERREDFLGSYADLVAWADHAGALNAGEARRLRPRARREPGAGEDVVRRARALREALYALLAPARRDAERGAALAVLNEELRRALAHAALERADGGFRLATAADDDLDRVLRPVARSALELVTSEELGRTRECAGDGCGWLFVDRSRSGRRRWCSMDSCGNRAKARSYRRRHRAERE